jgi:hypothetical protein
MVRVKLCVLVTAGPKMVVPAGCTHACIAARLRGDTMEACVLHAVLLGCTI